MAGIQYDVNSFIRNYTLKDYGKSDAPPGTKLDCSLGVNPDPIPATVLSELGKITEDTVKHYPHDETILDAIAKYYRNKSKGLQWLTKANIYIGDGTTDILHNLNVLCLCHDIDTPANSKRVLGHAPQFTAFVDQVNCLGAIYDSYKMEKSNKYKFVSATYYNQMSANHSLFIVENPNNPTGQIIDLYDIERIAKNALSMGRLLVVDEAYGDYMEIENSAIQLIKTYPNVVVTRTFSKGFGMAGIRLGYLITSDATISDTITQFKKVENQFNCNSIARVLGKTFLDLNTAIPDLKVISANKSMVMSVIKKMTIATTSLTTPIMTLYYDGNIPEGNLQTFLSNYVQLWTVSCESFDQLDKKAVRLMLPKTTAIETLKSMLSKAETYLS